MGKGSPCNRLSLCNYSRGVIAKTDFFNQLEFLIFGFNSTTVSVDEQNIISH